MRKLPAYTCLAFGAILAAPSGQAVAAEGQYVVGVSNTLIGNGWREEMVCSIKAEALASGKVSKVVSGQPQWRPAPSRSPNLRNLISAGVNIIIVNPSDRKALEPGHQAGDRQGHRRGRGRSGGFRPRGLCLDQRSGGLWQLGAEALFKKLGGKGNVVEMRGIDGVPADVGPPRGLHGGAQEISRHQGRGLGLHRLVAGQRPHSRSRNSSAPARRSTASGPPASTRRDRRRLQVGKCEVRAGGRRRQQRLSWARMIRAEGCRLGRHRRDQSAGGRRSRSRPRAVHRRRQEEPHLDPSHAGSLRQLRPQAGVDWVKSVYDPKVDPDTRCIARYSPIRTTPSTRKRPARDRAKVMLFRG